MRLLVGLAVVLAGIACGQEMPGVKDWGSVRVKLDRGACFGFCASYSVEVGGDGVIRYEGRGYVTVRGKHEDRIERARVDELLEAFRDAEFWGLKSKYGPDNISDVPSFTLTVTVDGVTKSVEDRFGVQAGMPQVVTDLESAVDFYGHTTQWVFGDPDTVALLRREGFDFTLAEAGAMLASAAYHGHVNAVRELIEAGAPVEGRSDLCRVTLLCAAANHNVEVLRMLIAAGASKGDQAMKDAALRAAVGRENREAVRLLEEYGARRVQ